MIYSLQYMTILWGRGRITIWKGSGFANLRFSLSCCCEPEQN